MSTIYYPCSTIAKLLDITERRVQQLAQDGILPKGEKNKYDLVGCVRGYIRYLRQSEMGPVDSHTERARLLKARADKTEIEVHVLQRDLIPAEDIKTVWLNVANAIRARLLAFPTKAAHVVLSLTSYKETEEALRELIYEMLTELSKTDADRLILNVGGASATSDGTAAAPDGEPVGRQAPEA